MSTKTLSQVRDFQESAQKIYGEKLNNIVNQTMDIAIEEGFEIFVVVLKPDKISKTSYVRVLMDGPKGTEISLPTRALKNLLKGLFPTVLGLN